MSVTVTKLTIPTYPEPEAQELPMFAENRVHQRTGGNPYPQKVVVEVNRSQKVDREYTAVILENAYLRLCILPQLGGRIYSATDKRTGYDFFYKNRVIKPALIGCLGSWISGGMEFNWPFHHRPSTFLPVDYHVCTEEDGTDCVYLSEHDPMERMKGMVCVRLPGDAAWFETRVRLYNRTDSPRSFLWWENTAVPVNEDYQIFFPPDVQYVNFHYKRSVTTYPVADNSLGIFNGIRYPSPTDISLHKNTRQPTSYFCAPSRYDFFGGYDHGRGCGVVHIADRHISPGKKMFTWAYNQLSRSWENALTDEDGAYAELMAGVYSDNQPDFAWLQPGEVKEFSQFWYPIGDLGVPVFANLNGALHADDDGLKLQLTETHADCTLCITRADAVVLKKEISADCGRIISFPGTVCAAGDRVTVEANGKYILDFTFFAKKDAVIPPLTEDLPQADTVTSATTLYLEGVHVQQYRDPAVKPDYYWKKALEREPSHVPSLLALGEYALDHLDIAAAEGYLSLAFRTQTAFNSHPVSGRLYYLLGRLCLARKDTEGAYDHFCQAAWSMDYGSPAMTFAAALDVARKDYDKAVSHADQALCCNARNAKAAVYKALALAGTDPRRAQTLLLQLLQADPLDHLARAALVLTGGLSVADFFAGLHSDPAQTVLDIRDDLTLAGADTEIFLKNIPQKTAMVQYFLGQQGSAPVGRCFPFRASEKEVLERTEEPEAGYLLGCLYYGHRQYEAAAACWERVLSLQPTHWQAMRCLSVVWHSHLQKKEEALALLENALALQPENGQLLFEYCTVCPRPEKRIGLILASKITRDDIYIALANAYNELGQYEKALQVLASHTFVPCEGGEHAIADQYMFAVHALGRRLLDSGCCEEALEKFIQAQKLPQNLGAGIWNEVKYIPHRYYQALCLQKLGRTEEAAEILRSIAGHVRDYFTEMHLKALPCYQAMALEALGQHLPARAVLDEACRRWEKALELEDPGFFATTPFFISHCPEPKAARKACYSALLAFAARILGDREKAKALAACANDPYLKLQIQ